MRRIERRVELAIKRAAARYCAEFYLAPKGAGRLKLTAVKRVARAEEFDGLDASTLARRVEFLVPASELGVISLRYSIDARTDLDFYRKAKIVEIDSNGRETFYQIDPARTYLPNSPENGSIRFFAFQVKG